MQNMGERSGLYWIGGAVLAAVVFGAVLAYSPLVGAVFIGPVLAFAIFTRRPQLGFIAWLVSICVVPCWIGAEAGVFVPASLIGAIIALTCLFVGAKWIPGKADMTVGALLVVCALGVSFGSDSGTSSAAVFTSMFTLWLPGYFVGRFVCEKAGMTFVKSSVAVALGIVGLLALSEKIFSWHVFSGMVGMNSLSEIWAPIQIRGGVERSEWAFGHSIALGGSLALAIPFLISSTLKTKTKVVLLALTIGGVAVTLSRGAMLAAGLTLVLALLTSRTLKSGQKFLLILTASGLGIYTAVGFANVSEVAGTEVSDSSGYRVSLFNQLFSTLQPIGRSSSFQSGAGNQVQYGNFTSIDNTFMALGLGFGWIAMLAVTLPFMVMGFRFIRRRASFAEVALLGQLPVLTTVAMITQYQVLVWMVAGLAATLAGSSKASGALEGKADESSSASPTPFSSSHAAPNRHSLAYSRPTAPTSEAGGHHGASNRSA